MNILIFGFKGTIAQKVVSKINTPADKFYLESSEDALNDFVMTTNFQKYDYVLGLGMYSHSDREALRIEIECCNKFRKIANTLITLNIPYFLHPAQNIKLADGIGNSWCNLVSYEILQKSPNTKYTFLHVPKYFNSNKAIKVIDEQLKQLK